MEDVLTHDDRFECSTCGHEWPRDKPEEPEATDEVRVVKDANGNVLADGDSVTLIKDLKLRGSTEVLKQGTKVKSIRIVDGDHEIDCKIDGTPMALCGGRPTNVARRMIWMTCNGTTSTASCGCADQQASNAHGSPHSRPWPWSSSRGSCRGDGEGSRVRDECQPGHGEGR
jgi:protein PhnA